MDIYLETERLIIRALELSDVHGIYELDTNPEVHRYLGNRPIQHLEQAEKTIQQVRQQYIENGVGRWAVVEKSSRQFIGWTGLKLITESINQHTHFYEVGYRFIQRFWGKGYATETAIASLDYGFETMQLKEIFAMANTAHGASNRILSKIGMTVLNEFEYDSQPHYFYKIDKASWAVNKNK